MIDDRQNNDLVLPLADLFSGLDSDFYGLAQLSDAEHSGFCNPFVGRAREI